MKTRNRFLLIIILMIAGTFTLSAQTKKEKEELKRQELKEVIDSKNYKIDVDRAYPRRGSSRSLTSPYSLEIRNDSVISWLPFFGRAYSIPYGGGDGLTFSAPISEYKVNYSKKGAAKINISAHTSEDQFKFAVTVQPGGASTISVNMVNRESISFSGRLDDKE